jgi:hypothetical protein
MSPDITVVGTAGSVCGPTGKAVLSFASEFNLIIAVSGWDTQNHFQIRYFLHSQKLLS